VSVEATSDEDWSATLAANLSGPFFVTRALLPSMRARGSGRFVFVASISSTLGTPRLSAYWASKWGVVGFAKSLAEELRGSGLSALSVLPGSVDTDMLAGSGFPPQMGPDEVARTIVLLALDAPASMNSSAVEMFGP
jgi:3-oxoacyl-[acyl-carrier protein] reductase